MYAAAARLESVLGGHESTRRNRLTAITKLELLGSEDISKLLVLDGDSGVGNDGDDLEFGVNLFSCASVLAHRSITRIKVGGESVKRGALLDISDISCQNEYSPASIRGHEVANVYQSEQVSPLTILTVNER